MSEVQKMVRELSGLLVGFSGMTKNAVRTAKTKPLAGPTFGAGDFCIASYVFTSGGLHKVSFFVLHASSGIPIAYGESKAEAISAAGGMIRRCRGELMSALFSAARQIREKEIADDVVAKAQAREAISKAKSAAKADRIPRRRRAVFDASKGSCHYCGTTLQIDGKWHIEHKMPRALLGTNEPSNLVASCVKCNMEKRDRTDAEYIAMRAERRAA